MVFFLNFGQGKYCVFIKNEKILSKYKILCRLCYEKRLQLPTIAMMMELVRSHLYDRCVTLNNTFGHMDSKRFL